MRQSCTHLLLALDRRFGFYSRANVAVTVVTVALTGGLISLWLGQDTNWDLRNYHLYAGYAWLHDRLSQDLAPAQLQSYFSPMLDVLHYLLLMSVPAPLAGFVLGVLQSLVFVPLAAIVWLGLQERPWRASATPLVALAGMCGSTFLSGFGSTMGDGSSAVAVIAALALTLQAQRSSAGRAMTLWLLAGGFLGVALTCKLTNAIYALALGVTALTVGADWRNRLCGAALLTVATVLVALLMVGPWYWRVWQEFGNPLLPQFNALFQAPLAQPISVADTRWVPRGVLEHIIWPVLFTLNPWRISEIGLFQCSWALLYLLAVIGLLRCVLRCPPRAEPSNPALHATMVFFVVGYGLWQILFSIHRYLSVLDLLMPLALWFACRHAVAKTQATKVAGVLIGLAALVALIGWNDWGRASWAWRSFQVQLPTLAEPRRSLVLLVGNEPQSWRIAFLPPSAIYASVASNFPESQVYRQRISGLFAMRSERYALLPAVYDKQVDLEAANRAFRDAAAGKLAGYGLALDIGSCQVYSSWIGRSDFPYQWCRVVAAGS
jgi:uncharacterized integral membrane protein